MVFGTLNGFISGLFSSDAISLIAVQSGPGISRLKVYTLDSSGFAQLLKIQSVIGDVIALEKGDFNSDGKLDLAFVSATSVEGNEQVSLQLYLNVGDATFVPQQVIPLNIDPTSIRQNLFFQAGDLNRDGKLDFVIGREVLLGKGGGTFDRQLPPLQVNPVAMGVFRSPGLLDLIVQTTPTELSFYAGRGNGSFLPQSILPLRPGHILLGDWNGDGIIDIASDSASPITMNAPPAIPFQGSLIAVLGRGDGTFETPTASASWGGPYSVADLNLDGRDDIVMGNSIATSRGDGYFDTPVFLRLTSIVCPYSPPSQSCAAKVLSTAVIQLPANRDRSLLFFSSILSGASNLVSVLRRSMSTPSLYVPGVSSATGSLPIGDRSIVSIFGANLAKETASAVAFPVSTFLGGIRIHLRNQAGDSFLAPLFFVSPTQINFSLDAVPSSRGEDVYNLERSGQFTSISIEKDGEPYQESAISIVTTALAPGLFTAGLSNFAASTAFRLDQDGTRTPVLTVSCSAENCQGVPIDLSQGPVYISLYGTGFSVSTVRTGVASQVPISAECGDVGTLIFQGSQGIIQGLDQINLLLRRTQQSSVTFSCSFYNKAVTPQEVFTTQPVTLLFK